MTQPELSRVLDVRQIDGRTIDVAASPEERAALAKRFGLVRIDSLESRILLERDGSAVRAIGALDASFVQSCAVSAEDMPVTVHEPVTLRFVSHTATPAHDEEVELELDELDEIPIEGTTIDIGEAVAQCLALAIDPYAVGPHAEAMRRDSEFLGNSGFHPFSVLAPRPDKA